MRFSSWAMKKRKSKLEDFERFKLKIVDKILEFKNKLKACIKMRQNILVGLSYNTTFLC